MSRLEGHKRRSSPDIWIEHMDRNGGKLYLHLRLLWRLLIYPCEIKKQALALNRKKKPPQTLYQSSPSFYLKIYVALPVISNRSSVRPSTGLDYSETAQVNPPCEQKLGMFKNAHLAHGVHTGQTGRAIFFLYCLLEHVRHLQSEEAWCAMSKQC